MAVTRQPVCTVTPFSPIISLYTMWSQSLQPFMICGSISRMVTWVCGRWLNSTAVSTPMRPPPMTTTSPSGRGPPSFSASTARVTFAPSAPGTGSPAGVVPVATITASKPARSSQPASFSTTFTPCLFTWVTRYFSASRMSALNSG